MSSSAAKSVTVLGTICVAAGLLWAFLGSEFAFRFFSNSLNNFITGNAGFFLIALPSGILLSAAGVVALARDFNRRKKLRVAGWIFLAGLLSIIFAPKYVHGPGMLLVLTAVCVCVLGIVLTVLAFASHTEPEDGHQRPT